MAARRKAQSVQGIRQGGNKGIQKIKEDEMSNDYANNPITIQHR